MRRRGIACGLTVSVVAALGAAGMTDGAHASDVVASANAVTLGAKPYDFNGDGRADLALGSPYGTVGTVQYAGFVTIVYGGAAGPDASTKTIISQDTAGVPGVAETSDHFGFSLASLDYNRDGYADLLVGAPDEDTSAGTDAGGEWILWGTSSGLTGVSADTMPEPTNTAGDGPGANHRFGYALAAGDFDDDGYADWTDTAPGSGFFWLMSSKPDAVAPHASAAPAFRPSARGEAVRGSGVRALASGRSFDALIPAVGDIDGDHRDDLVVAWRNSAATPEEQYGFDVWTNVFGTSGGFKEVLTRVDGLAVGDFNGDGYADVATGAADDGGSAGSHVTIFNGDAAIGMADSYLINENTPGVPGPMAAGDQFGYSLSASDVTNDGRSDLVVGVPGRDIGGQDQAGEAIVLYGSANGLTGTGAEAFSQDSPNVPGVAEALDHFGWQVGLLHTTGGDDYHELIAGAPLENGKDGAVTVLLRLNGTWIQPETFGAGTLGVTGRDAQIGVRIGRPG